MALFGSQLAMRSAGFSVNLKEFHIHGEVKRYVEKQCFVKIPVDCMNELFVYKTFNSYFYIQDIYHCLYQIEYVFNAGCVPIKAN